MEIERCLFQKITTASETNIVPKDSSTGTLSDLSFAMLIVLPSHYSHSSMLIRSALTALDYNANIAREQVRLFITCQFWIYFFILGKNCEWCAPV